jgi:hypothetical protein
MIKKFFCTVLIIVLAASLSFAGSDTTIKEGQWEITMKVEMQGMNADVPPMKYTKCLTGKDSLPVDQSTASQCTMADVKTVGNTVTWKLKCTEQAGGMEGSGKIVYHGDTFDGTITMSLNDPEEGKINMVQRITGKRLGDCK